VNSILTRMRGSSAPAVSLLRRGVTTVRNHLAGVGEAVQSQLRGRGRQVFGGLRTLGTQVFGLVQRAAGGVTQRLGGDLSGVRRLGVRVREGIFGIGWRVMDLVGTAPLRIRALVLDPIRDLAQTGVAAAKEQVRVVFGNVWQGWSALKQSVRSAGYGTGPAQGGPAATQEGQAGTQHTGEGG
jgi:hypothetical protein